MSDVSEPARRVGLVTGAASGIGGASARMLAAEGVHVTVLDTDHAGGEETVRMIRDAVDFAALGVRVNAVLPGVVDTAMSRAIGSEEEIAAMGAATPIGRVAAPEEVAAAVVWLLSDAASYVTGHRLAVDGALGIPLPTPPIAPLG